MNFSDSISKNNAYIKLHHFTLGTTKTSEYYRTEKREEVVKICVFFTSLHQILKPVSSLCRILSVHEYKRKHFFQLSVFFSHFIIANFKRLENVLECMNVSFRFRKL